MWGEGDLPGIPYHDYELLRYADQKGGVVVQEVRVAAFSALSSSIRVVELCDIGL